LQESEDSVLGEKERRVNFMDVPMSWMKEYAPVTADIKDFIEVVRFQSRGLHNRSR